MSPTTDKRYLPGKSPLAISKEMYDWTLEEGYTAPPSRSTLEKDRLKMRNKKGRLALLSYGFPTFYQSFETPDKDLCEDVIKTIENIFDVYFKTSVDQVKKVPKKFIKALDSSYNSPLEELMSMSWADFEYLEKKLPKVVFDAIANYLQSPKAKSKYEK